MGFSTLIGSAQLNIISVRNIALPLKNDFDLKVEVWKLAPQVI